MQKMWKNYGYNEHEMKLEERIFREPEIYTKGEYCYHCKIDGAFVWYQGYKEIFYLDEKYMSIIFVRNP